MRQLAEGLKMLRQRNIVHRDLKPQVLPKDILIWSLLVGLGVIYPHGPSVH